MKENRKGLYAEHNGRRFRIIRDAAVGFYLFVYDAHQPERSTHDYLQDTLEIAQQFAREHFDVPLENWKSE